MCHARRSTGSVRFSAGFCNERRRPNNMGETKSSSGDSKKTTRRGSAKLRLVIGATLLLVAMALVIWIRSVTWQRVAELEAEFAAIQSERFLLGLHARES